MVMVFKVVVLPMLVALAAAGADMNHSTSSLVDWWAGAVEEDAIRSLPLDGEGGLWASAFVPPPPRPDFLDDHATPDGLTTCDLCSWAWHDRGGIFSIDSAHDSSGELGWMLTLAIVSILSAAIGAVVMVTVLQCRKSPSPAAAPAAPQDRVPNVDGNKDISVPRAAFADGDVSLGSATTTAAAAGSSSTGGRGRVWTWLTARRSAAGPPQLCSAPGSTAPAENHYTLDEVYGEEALYAELDRDLSPAYQNTAYTGSDGDPDAPPSSSAPSSAYYSDLSCATGPDRTYEAVGLALGTTWDGGDRRRLAAITETITVPSDYV